MKNKKLNVSTKIVHSGLNPEKNFGIPNPPVYHASTILHKNSQEYRNRKNNVKYEYGRYGTPTSDALTESISDLYKADGAVLTPSGLSACVVAILSFAKSDNHILVTDNIYGSTRNFITKMLPSYGISYEFFNPRINLKDLKELFKKNTSLIYLESPGSLTFEIQDIPKISKIAKSQNITVIADNTWATSLGMNCFDSGVNVVVESITKYVSGHSDVMMGCVVSNKSYLNKIKQTAKLLGQCSGPDDIYLALRGLRTLKLRLERSFKTSIQLANWLIKQKMVNKVYHPAIKEHPDNSIFKKNYKIGAGLFSFELKTKKISVVDKFINSLQLFGIGASWGGYESLISITDLEKIRTFNFYKNTVLIRIAIGMEDPDDLIEDLNNAFQKIKPNNY